MVALFHARLLLNTNRRWRFGISAANIEEMLRKLPRSAVPEYRTKRAYISGVLARHEVGRDAPYNRRLFKRMERGYYVLNPQMRVRIGTNWIRIYDLLDTDALFARWGDAPGVPTFRRLLAASEEGE